MKNFIKQLLVKLTCCHDWNTFSHLRIVDEIGDEIGHRYIFICKKCGKFKRIKA